MQNCGWTAAWIDKTARCTHRTTWVSTLRGVDTGGGGGDANPAFYKAPERLVVVLVALPPCVYKVSSRWDPPRFSVALFPRFGHPIIRARS